MSNVVNLNKFRKQKAKQARVKQADTNRRLHGRTSAERGHDALQKNKLETNVDHARLECPPKPACDETESDDESTGD